MKKQDAIECLKENVTCTLKEPRQLAINALEMQIEIEKCINGCAIDTMKVIDIVSEYLMDC